ncbi:MAG TPA: hypothetical protein DHD79_07410 [Firmicutes bacterium]|nr:hypothetical protein [Bacillota bacterium]HAZ22646.1 hypothetical protein [Bacillota bacterium]HBE05933.1 hypothetical protein [Bacillota bacterium]HBG44891.1 hypothetical protein [Bacillota bacterium]HBL67799.1 hypothetical protein [Bacillota bacterium]
MSGLTVGIIGMGFMGSVHARHYRDNGRVDRLLVATPVEQEQKIARERFGAEVFSDYRSMIQQGQPQAVSICTPNFDHYEIASWLMQEAPGIAILIEKPLGVNDQQVAKLTKLAAGHQSPILVGHSLRFAGAYIKGRELLRQNAIGKPCYLEARYKWFKDFSKFPAWKRDPELSGGGFLMQSGLHMLDLFVWYADSPVVEVTGHAEDLYFKDFPVEDTFFGTVRFANGVAAHLVGSSATKGFIDYGIEVYGERGAIKVESVAVPGGLDIDNHSVSLFTEESAYSPSGALVIPSAPKSDFWKDEINHFVSCVLDGTAPIVTPADAKIVMDVCFALYKSAALGGKTIRL